MVIFVDVLTGHTSNGRISAVIVAGQFDRDRHYETTGQI